MGDRHTEQGQGPSLPGPRGTPGASCPGGCGLCRESSLPGIKTMSDASGDQGEARGLDQATWGHVLWEKRGGLHREVGNVRCAPRWPGSDTEVTG